jgi:2'-5' RNA ligase
MEQSKAFEALSMRFRNTFTTTENRKPNPHITIARIKKLKQLPFELPHLNAFSFKACSIELYESITHAAGAEYQLIKEWKLQ